MTRIDGSLARPVLGETASGGMSAVSGRRPMLRLAPAAMRLRGPERYKVLDARRRHAQIKARRLLDLMENQESGR